MSAFLLKGKNDAKWLSLVVAASGYYFFGPSGAVPLALASKCFGPVLVDFLDGLKDAGLSEMFASLLRDLSKDKIKATLPLLSRPPKDMNHHLRRAFVLSAARSLKSQQDVLAQNLGNNANQNATKAVILACFKRLTDIADSTDVAALDNVFPERTQDLDIARLVDQFETADESSTVENASFWGEFYKLTIEQTVISHIERCSSWARGGHALGEKIVKMWPNHVPFAFADELKQASPEAKKAWIGYQRLLLTNTRSLIQQVANRQEAAGAKIDEVFAQLVENNTLITDYANTVTARMAGVETGIELLCSSFAALNSTQTNFQKRVLDAINDQGLLSIGRVVHCDMFVPSEDECEKKKYAGILTGQQVLPVHLAYGMVAERPKRFAFLWKAFESWMANANGSQQKIPVFWICGRSGEGKSVFRWQLLRELVRRQPAKPVFNLFGGGKLAQFLEIVQCTSLPLDNGSSWLVTVDDLFDVMDRDDWVSRITAVSGVGIPPVCIVTCGPTDQLHEFEAALVGQVEVTTFEVFPVAKDEFSLFSSFVSERLERPVAVNFGTSAGIGNSALLVLAMFEADQGSTLAEFGKRFRHRMELAGVLDVVEPVIALNALYLYAPEELARTHAERDIMRQLCAEDQLHFEYVEGGGYRLLHPHLAGLLLQAWALQAKGLPGLGKYWARLLTSTLEIIHHKDNHIGRLVSLFRAIENMLHVKAEQKAEFVIELYRNHCSLHNDAPSVATLANWVKLARNNPTYKLAPCPFDLMVSWLMQDAVPDNVSAWAWAILYAEADKRYPSQAKAIKDSILNYFRMHAGILDIPPALSWLLGRRQSEPFLSGYAREWAMCNDTHPRLVTVLHTLITGQKDVSPYLDITRRWLGRNAKHPQAIRLMCALLVRTRGLEQDVSMALKWLSEDKHQQVAVLLCTLVARANFGHNEWGVVRDWVLNHLEFPQTGMVLGAMVAKSGLDEKDWAIAQDWARRNIEYPQSYTLIAAMLASKNCTREDVETALIICHTRADQPHICGLLTAITACRCAIGGDYGHIRDWIGAHMDNQNIYQVLEALVAGKHATVDDFNLAEKWLRDHVKHDHAANLMRTLLARSGDRPEFVDFACERLEVLPRKKRNNVLAVIILRTHASEKYIDLLLDAAERCEDDGEFNFLMLALGKAALRNLNNVGKWIRATHMPEHHSSVDERKWSVRRTRVARALARAITQTAKRAPDHDQDLEPLNEWPADDVAIVFFWLIEQGCLSTKIDSLLAAWLDQQYRGHCYNLVLVKLRSKSQSLKRLLDAKLLSARIVEDCGIRTGSSKQQMNGARLGVTSSGVIGMHRPSGWASRTRNTTERKST